MRSEAVGILELVRAVALILSMIGITITDDEAQVIAAGIGAAMLAVSAILSVIARSSVFSRETVETKYVPAGVESTAAPPDPRAG